jgi:hypothetical protein
MTIHKPDPVPKTVIHPPIKDHTPDKEVAPPKRPPPLEPAVHLAPPTGVVPLGEGSEVNYFAHPVKEELTADEKEADKEGEKRYK